MSSRQLVTLNIPVINTSEFMIFTTGDWHLGSVCCSYDGIKSFIERVLSYKGPKIVNLQGDMIECITSDDGRFDMDALDYEITGDDMNIEYKEYMEENKQNMKFDDVGVKVRAVDITSQKEILTTLLKPIAKYIGGFHTGNHENKLHRKGYRVMREFVSTMATNRGWKGKYMGYTSDVKLVVTNSRNNKNNMYFVSTHGYGGATKRHTKLKKVIDFVCGEPFFYDNGNLQQVQAGYFGHLHDTNSERIPISVPNYDYAKKMAMPAHAILTGHFLDANAYDKANYAIKMGLSHTPMGWIETLVGSDAKIKNVEPKYYE